MDIGKVEHRVVFSGRVSSGESRGTASAAASETASFSGSGNVGPEVSHLGWGRWYTLRELEAATNGLCEENVIGEGGYGIVYRGVLNDGTKVAVKNLLNNRSIITRLGLLNYIYRLCFWNLISIKCKINLSFNLQGSGGKGVQSRGGSDWACTTQESR